MLYVSRRIRHNYYGVVDTDDGIEEEVGTISLSAALNFVDIAGVQMYRQRFQTVTVYQADMYKTTLMGKYSVLLGVDVSVWRQYVTNIKWHNSKITTPVRLRLSDFAKECAAAILVENVDSDSHKVTIVLDDYIKYDDQSFNPEWFRKRLDMVGVKFDVREVTDDERVFIIYETVAVAMVNRFRCTEIIVDNTERQKRMLMRLGVMEF